MYNYGFSASDDSKAKNSHMRSILEEQVQSLIDSMTAYEIARAKSEPQSIRTVYRIALERAQSQGITILREALVNHRALALQFALAIMTQK